MGVLYHRFSWRCGLRFGNASCVTDVWSPYRITPIHWLMAQRRLWCNHVVSLNWRTHHPLLRFLCLHEAVTLPFVVAIFWPKNIVFRTRFIHLHFGDCLQWNFVLLAVKCHGLSPLSQSVSHSVERTSRVTCVTLVLWIGNEMLRLLPSSTRCQQGSFRQRNLRSGWRVRQYKLTTWLRQRRRRTISQWMGVILKGLQTSVTQEAFPKRKPQRLVPYSENKGYTSNPRRFITYQKKKSKFRLPK